jgi:hypothetical protein
MASERAKRGCAMSIARLWVVGALVAALMALVPGVAWAAGVTSSVGTLAGDALGQSASSGDEDDYGGDDDGEDDDGDDDDDGGGGGQDRAFCAPAGPPEAGQCFALGVDFDFDATSGPLGENPTGTYVFTNARESFQLEITCLLVTGNRASFGGRVTASNFFPIGSGFAFTVVDNAPAVDLVSLGTFLAAGPPPPNTPNCGDVTQPVHPVSEGDIVVQDNVGAGGGGGDDDDGDDDGDDGDD